MESVWMDEDRENLREIDNYLAAPPATAVKETGVITLLDTSPKSVILSLMLRIVFGGF